MQVRIHQHYARWCSLNLFQPSPAPRLPPKLSALLCPHQPLMALFFYFTLDNSVLSMFFFWQTLTGLVSYCCYFLWHPRPKKGQWMLIWLQYPLLLLCSALSLLNGAAAYYSMWQLLLLMSYYLYCCHVLHCFGLLMQMGASDLFLYVYISVVAIVSRRHHFGPGFEP